MEPIDRGGRLTSEMHHFAHSDHARHDLDLIAGHAAGDLTNLDVAAVSALLESCNTCADVHRDLVAIASATRALPRTARSPRDFRLSADQAERLRRGSWLGSLLRPFASARSATRPMARALTSLGVAGLLVTVLLPGVLGGLGGAASAPTQREDSLYAGAAASQAPAVNQGAPGNASVDPDAAVDAEATKLAIAVGGASPDVRVGDPKVESGGDLLAVDTPPNPWLIGSVALLALGLTIFGLRFAARRLR